MKEIDTTYDFYEDTYKETGGKKNKKNKRRISFEKGEEKQGVCYLVIYLELYKIIFLHCMHHHTAAVHSYVVYEIKLICELRLLRRK